MPRTRVSREMREKARSLRQSMTKTEWLLWKELRDLKSEGLKFRRQAPIGPYIVDFVCLAEKFVVEVDGDTHEDAQARIHDQVRDQYLIGLGYRILRISAPDVLENAWHCAQDIKAHCHL